MGNGMRGGKCSLVSRKFSPGPCSVLQREMCAGAGGLSYGLMHQTMAKSSRRSSKRPPPPETAHSALQTC